MSARLQDCQQQDCEEIPYLSIMMVLGLGEGRHGIGSDSLSRAIGTPSFNDLKSFRDGKVLGAGSTFGLGIGLSRVHYLIRGILYSLSLGLVNRSWGKGDTRTQDAFSRSLINMTMKAQQPETRGKAPKKRLIGMHLSSRNVADQSPDQDHENTRSKSKERCFAR